MPQLPGTLEVSSVTNINICSNQNSTETHKNKIPSLRLDCELLIN